MGRLVAFPSMTGIIYCRVSSKEQIEGTSLVSQQQACQEYARAKNIKVLKTFIEQGESAKFADRTQLLELIDFCKQNKGKVEVLLVWKVDRFARNVGDHFNIKAILMKYGVRIVSVTEPIDANPEGKLMETILAGFAQFDNDIRATRTVQGMRRRIQEGIFPWKAPLGYTSSTKNGGKKTEPDRPDQLLFGSLQKAWRELATGAYTKAELRRLVMGLGVLTKKGKPLSPQSLDGLFSNPFYAGILVDPWSGEEYPGKHVPMVTPAEFAKVQQVINRRRRSIPHQRIRPEFPLRGLVRCSHCLQYLTAGFSRGRSRTYAYYNCYNQKCEYRGKSCQTQPLHQEFEAFLATIAPKPEKLDHLKEILVQISEEYRESTKKRKPRLESELRGVNKQIQELIGMRTQGLVTDEEFSAQKSILVDRRSAVESRREVDSISKEEIYQQFDEITAPLTHLNESWKILPDPFRRRFERILLPVGFPNGRIRTAELGLIFKVFGESVDGKLTEVALIRKFLNQIWAEIKDFSSLFRSWRDETDEAERRFEKNPMNNLQL